MLCPYHLYRSPKKLGDYYLTYFLSGIGELQLRSKRKSNNIMDKVGSIPEFTDADSASETQEEEVKQEETTPSESSTEEPSGEIQPKAKEPQKVEESQPEEMSAEDTDELAKQNQGLREEKEKLLDEIMSLRGDRRHLKEEKVQQVVQKTEDLIKDLNPADVELFKKIAKATGYVSQEELNSKFYNEVKQEELNKFLESHPEYKPENDPGDRKWNSFREELRLFFRMPENPRDVGMVLNKAHRSLSQIGERSIGSEAQRKTIETASIGSKGAPSGAKPSSSLNSFDQDKVWSLRSGGYSDEEIIKILNKVEKGE